MDLTARLTSLVGDLIGTAAAALEPDGPGMPYGDPRMCKEAVQALVLVMAELRHLDTKPDPDAETPGDAEFRRVLQKAGIDLEDL